MRRAILLTAAVVAVALALPAGATAAIPCGNLLVNGGVDAGGPSDWDAVPPQGWQTTGQFDAVSYATSGSPPAPTATSGVNYMTGGRAALSTGTQVIDLAGAAAEIGAGGVSAVLSGDLGGFADQSDTAGVDLAWINAQGTEIGALTLNPAGPAERANQTILIHRNANGSVPPAAARVRVTVTMTRLGGTDNDGYADNVSLVLGPEPASCRTPPVTRQPASVTQPRGSCGNAPGQQVCIAAPPDILKYGCVRTGPFVHRFGVKLKKRSGGLLVNRRSRVRIVDFSLDGRASGSDARRPYFAAVDGSVLRQGTHNLLADVFMRVPKSPKAFTKHLRFKFRTC